MISNQDWNKQLSYFWPIETCQKLFYDENVVVNTLSRVKSDRNLGINNCYVNVMLLIEINDVAILLIISLKW